MDTETQSQGEEVPTTVPQAAEFLGSTAVDSEAGDVAATMDALAARLILDDEPEEPDIEESVRQTIGTFFVNDAEFALAANCVREVVPYPDQVTKVPLTPESFHGVFSLRGEVLPLLDAASLLSTHSGVDREQRRVAIVDAVDGHVGIAFDRTGEVLRINSNDRFGLYDSKGQSKGVINGIIQLEGGDRCIQELSAGLLGSIPDIPYSKDSESRAVGQVDSTVYRKVVSVRVGNYELAFPMDNLVEIQENLTIQPSPPYFDNCKGVLHLRGKLHTVMDFRSALGLPAEEGQKKFVFIQHEGATVALEVDSLVETIEYDENAPLALPQMPSNGIAEVCDCVLPLDPERHILMVDVERIFERYEIAQSISTLNLQAGADGDNGDTQLDEDERAVFTFQLGGHSLSLEMEDVLEVQPYPDSIIESTTGDTAVVGIMNLRGSVTPLINLRKRFQLPPWEAAEESGEEAPVVIVVEGADSPYGLIVDKVDRIHRFFPSQSHMVQTLLNRQSLGESLLGYVKAALMLDGDGPEKKDSNFLLIVDTEKLTTI